MKVENLEKARSLLIDAYLELDESIDDAENSEDTAVQQIDLHKRSVQDIVGQLSVNIAKKQKENS